MDEFPHQSEKPKPSTHRSQLGPADFQSIVDLAPAITWLTGADGQCTYLSDQWFDFTGQSQESGLGFGWLGAVHEEDRLFATKTYSEAMRDRKPFAMDFRLKSRRKSFQWVLYTGNPRYDANKNFLGYVGNAVDIHEKKLAELGIKRSEEFLALALDASKIGFYEWDIQKNEVTLSPQMCKDWGITQEQIGPLKNATAHIHPDDRSRVEQVIAKCIMERTGYSSEYRVIRPSDGLIAWMEVRGKIEFSADGHPYR
ncbi:MAG: PAS domain S-box protein, partial [Proteobacteria bacterium]